MNWQAWPQRLGSLLREMPQSVHNARGAALAAWVSLRGSLPWIVAVVAMLMLAGPAMAQGPRRVALVIGNGAYARVRPLPNPTNDARAMAKSLLEA